jgi:hypothetical protein
VHSLSSAAPSLPCSPLASPDSNSSILLWAVWDSDPSPLTLQVKALPEVTAHPSSALTTSFLQAAMTPLPHTRHAFWEHLASCPHLLPWVLLQLQAHYLLCRLCLVHQCHHQQKKPWIYYSKLVIECLIAIFLQEICSDWMTLTHFLVTMEKHHQKPISGFSLSVPRSLITQALPGLISQVPISDLGKVTSVSTCNLWVLIHLDLERECCTQD